MNSIIAYFEKLFNLTIGSNTNKKVYSDIWYAWNQTGYFIAKAENDLVEVVDKNKLRENIQKRKWKKAI